MSEVLRVVQAFDETAEIVDPVRYTLRSAGIGHDRRTILTRTGFLHVYQYLRDLCGDDPEVNSIYEEIDSLDYLMWVLTQ